MTRTSKTNEAVSPVIATILLVAIAVVLVAIIGTLVMGMAGSTGSMKEVTIKLQGDVWTDTTNPNYTGAGVSVIILGGKDVDSLTALEVEIGGADKVVYFQKGQEFSWGANKIDPVDRVGTIGVFLPVPRTNLRSYEDVLVTVVGTFDDGTKAVLYQKQMSLPSRAAASDFLNNIGWNHVKNAKTSPIFK